MLAKTIQSKLKSMKIKRKIEHKLIQKKNRNKLMEKNRLKNQIYLECILEKSMEIN